MKSYANVALDTGMIANNVSHVLSELGLTLATVSSAPTAWSWTYTSAGSDLVADVSYDVWLSEDSTCSTSASCSTYEIMVRLTMVSVTWKLTPYS